MYKKRGQIWVETVIYTLIALLLIGLVLAFVTPKIGELQDRIIIEQTIDLMDNLQSVIFSIGDVPGNKRVVDVGVKRGVLTIDAANDTIIFELESGYEYSEVGEEINIGDVLIKTEKFSGENKITLISKYDGYDLKNEGLETEKVISQSSIPYKVSIENKGGLNSREIDFTVN